MIRLYFLFVLIVLSSVVVASRWLPVWGAAVLIPGTVIVLIWLTVWLIKNWFRKAVAKGLREATAVLEGAVVTVHDCHVVPEPESARRERVEEERARLEGSDDDDEFEIDPDEDGDDSGPVRWVALEVTIEPATRGVGGGEVDVIDPEHPPETEEPAMWEANSFLLVPRDTPAFDPKNGILSLTMGPQANVHRFERLSDDGEEVLLDTDELLDVEEAYDGGPPTGSTVGMARVRLTFGVPADLNGSVRLQYLTLDLAELVLPSR